MAWGDKANAILRAHRAAGRNVDDLPFMRERVDVPDHLLFTWGAFWALSTERQIGFGVVGQIPFRAILEYARAYGIAGVDALERFRRLITAMDHEFLESVRP